MVWWAWRQAASAGAKSVVVATDDPRIADVLMEAGADVAMTSADHPSGTDRLAEVARQREWSDDSIVVNLQGDEPLMPVVNIQQVAMELAQHEDASVATLCEPVDSIELLHDPGVVKVVASATGQALYFSRAAIPYQREPEGESSHLLLATARRHIGLYAYRCSFLKDFTCWPPAATEQLEALEQLRALERGHLIRVVDAAESVPTGVDTPDDLERIRDLLGR